MEDLETDTGLAFAMQGDPRIYATTRKIARVPLSDYVVDDPERRDSLVAAALSTASVNELKADKSSNASRLHELCSSLLAWQEAQTIQLHIDDRFRFQCLLHWLLSADPTSSAKASRRITSSAVIFLLKHVNDQYELLRSEDESLKEIMDARQDEGMPLTKAQMQRVDDVEDGLQGVAEAIKNVRELLEIAVEGGLVDGVLEMDAASAAPVAVEAQDGTEADLGSDDLEDRELREDVQPSIENEEEWEMDTSFGF